jgi:N-acetylglucosaminyldiphosphoundecaprenol N-acetyl-beta-D-mannosaminyltransferase
LAGDCPFFEFRLANDDPRDIVQAALSSPGASIVNTLNAHSFNVALTDAAFHDALLASDALVADGIGVVWAAQLKGAKGLRKISGADLFQASMELADEDNLTVGFLGSTTDVLDKISARASTEYPNTVVKTLSPPFAKAFSDAAAKDLLDQIGTIDILFVGMTAPKQEKFAHQVREFVNARAVLSIGAVFDFYAGTTKRAHPLFIKLGLEWLGRSIADPKRLGKRNLIAIPTFLFNCVKLSFR